MKETCLRIKDDGGCEICFPGAIWRRHRHTETADKVGNTAANDVNQSGQQQLL